MKKRYSAIILLLATVFALFCSACAQKTNYSPKMEHSLLSFYSVKDGNATTCFFADGKKLEGVIIGGIDALRTVDGTEGFIVAANSLYRIDASGIKKIYPAAVTNAVQPINGSAILFSSATKVFLYENDKEDFIQLPDIEAKGIVNLAISPDGKTAGIGVLTKDGTFKTYIYSDGKTEVLGSDRVIVAVADNNERCYYLKTSGDTVTGELHYVSGKTDKVITENASPYFEVNRDLTEITFDVKENTHFSKNGSKGVKLTDASILSFAGAQRATMGGSACTTLHKNADSLIESVFYTSITATGSYGKKYDRYNVYYVASDIKTRKLAGGADQFSVSEDGKNLLFLVDNKLYSMSVYNPKRVKTLATNIMNYCVGDDFSDLYLIDVYGNLQRYQNGKLSVVLVSGVDYAKRMGNGNILCYSTRLDDGTLIWLKDERANAIATNVSFFEAYENAAMYLTNYNENEKTFDLYMSEDGVEFYLGAQSVKVSG
ncbi:MAG: hypothetical protein IKS90_01460 [Clostridia bacterium]|nr:hypothetical protein [Clostridia bacterium]